MDIVVDVVKTYSAIDIIGSAFLFIFVAAATVCIVILTTMLLKMFREDFY